MLKFELQKQLNASNGSTMQLALALEVAEGEVLALYGVSGAGKTTLLRMIAGLEAPDSGQISYRGQVWWDGQARVSVPARSRRAGLLFQDYALFPNMSVRGQLGYTGAESHAIDALLHAFDLEGLAHVHPLQLSGGQKQRLALARTLAARPSLLLLDEPTSAQDLGHRKAVHAFLQKFIHENRTTTLLVTHDAAEVFKLADRVALIDHGKLTRMGQPLEVFAQGNGSMQGKGRVLQSAPTDQGHLVWVEYKGHCYRLNWDLSKGECPKPGEDVALDFLPLDDY